MRLIIGGDHRGRELCRKLERQLSGDNRFDVEHVEGTSEDVDYPDVAEWVASAISGGTADFGILVCGTGIGMCIVANKFPGVRAAPCHSELMAEMSRRHNDANILCLSSDLHGERSSFRIVEKWLQTPFDGGRHEQRLEKIREIELAASAFDAITPNGHACFVGPAQLRH